MKKIKQIIRMKVQAKLSFRQIAMALQISRPVVTKYITAFNASGLTFEEIQEMDDDTLFELLFGSSQERLSSNEKYADLSARFDYLLTELKKPHVTMQKLWEEYIEDYSEGYSRSQFCDHFYRWRKSCEITMHIEHKAGDRTFVDFTGKKLYLTDRQTGKKEAVETFVAILPASHYTFMCVTRTQKTQDWIKGTEEAFWYFGGTTTGITPDCCKSAVTKYNRYDPDINPEYNRFAEHYDTVILPARPGSPQDKALVENAVKNLYARIYASLRNEVFYTLEELNRAIRQQLDIYNGRKMQLTGKTRLELFEEIEKQELKPLPISLYEQKQCSKATIQNNYHIWLKAHNCYYSVPYRYYSQSILSKKKRIRCEVFYTDQTVEIYFKNQRIAHHKRSGKLYQTKQEHMPENHLRYLERWNPEKIIALASSKGVHVAELIAIMLTDCKHPEQAYKTCQGIIHLSKKYGSHRLNTACLKALYLGYHRYSAIRDMLINNKEEIEKEPDLFDGVLPEHHNLRGAHYFQQKLQELLHE